jgi:cell division protein FtsB
MRAEVASIERENATLLSEVRSLRTDSYVIERLAREQLGYARPGEIIFQFPADTPAVKPTTPPRAEPPRR